LTRKLVVFLSGNILDREFNKGEVLVDN